MKSGAGVLAISLLGPIFATAQDLPPEVLLLSRIKRHLRQEFSQLPNYTCLETSRRLNKAPGARSAMRALDVVRFEVLNTGRRELYAAPGQTDFREDHPFVFSASGLAASGLFAGFLQSLFIHDNGLFTWRRELAGQPGRRTIRYDYRVPLLTSGWHLQVAGAGGDVAMRGAVWVDAETFDLVRLRVQADDIPYNLGVSDATVILDYARTRIGNADVLLPQTGEVSMLHTSGQMSRNLFDYTHCRSFQAESTVSFVESNITFDPPSAGQASNPTALPAGLTVSIRLDTAISETQTLGTPLDGTVVADVSDRKKLLIPAGARVTGRLRRLDHDDAAGGFTLDLEFTGIRAGQAAYRFYAILESVAGDGRVETIPDSISNPSLPGVGLLLVRGSRFTIQPGLRLTWKTRPLAP